MQKDSISLTYFDVKKDTIKSFSNHPKSHQNEKEKDSLKLKKAEMNLFGI